METQNQTVKSTTVSSNTGIGNNKVLDLHHEGWEFSRFLSDEIKRIR